MNFTFSSNIILEDDCVILRPLQESDVDNLLEISLNEPETWKFSLVTAAGKENLIHYIQLAIKARENQKEFPFIVFDKKSQKYAGSTRFYDINFEFKTLQLGYTWYGAAFRGTGLNKHCKFLLLQFAFETLGMERVEFRADNNNVRSIAAMKSIGCKVEGILRSNMPTREGAIRRDSIVLSILRSEWFDEVKENLKQKL
ncbi:GNAT family N-acetyltransferase [Flavobacterium sp. Fl-77]|uniref:GNAT family N-acetyltransferase n=1 Tax=Flavobacterium flavipigmentatum TaxID=2893884 RepID=A0AAJ2S756_9FLAO|nr:MULTISPECIES: GNAT family N-acetyltransferase [unclassified Flavobacterium]MDX6181815.1 GNAT family N-acetyltransferase [Flavobacterium sp. Fl-33]MDX6185151.1 GNAT family N-acetyltransferase [Flavobacterium sp. Fl-77]UFH37258.1 GNAT family N-acetyltransferase [Flavobacterium sp. F-70]